MESFMLNLKMYANRSLPSRLCFSLLFFWGNLVVFGEDFQVEVGDKFVTSPAKNDLLAGIPFLSNLKLQDGDFFKLTDGEGKKHFGTRTFALNNEEDWVVTFSRLKIVDKSL